MRPLSYREVNALPKVIYLGSGRARIQCQVFWLQSFALWPYPMVFNSTDETLLATERETDNSEVISNSNHHCEASTGPCERERGSRNHSGKVREDDGWNEAYRVWACNAVLRKSISDRSVKPRSLKRGPVCLRNRMNSNHVVLIIYNMYYV